MIEPIILFRQKYEDLLLLGFLVTLCFCRHIAKQEFFTDRFFRIKKVDFFYKKSLILV